MPLAPYIPGIGAFGFFILLPMLGVVVGGFSKARVKGKHDLRARQTQRYCAPEVVVRTLWGYSYASDMWAVGCTIVELLLGSVLFPSVGCY